MGWLGRISSGIGNIVKKSTTSKLFYTESMSQQGQVSGEKQQQPVPANNVIFKSELESSLNTSVELWKGGRSLHVPMVLPRTRVAIPTPYSYNPAYIPIVTAKVKPKVEEEPKKVSTGQVQKKIRGWIPSPLFLSTDGVKWPVRSLEETSFVVVDTESDFEKMLWELNELQVTEIGFDVKQSNRTYKRLISLLILSTRFKDYLVDCIQLKDSVGQLQSIFENPYVLKITHCSSRIDVSCLLYDYNISVMSLYDIRVGEKTIRMVSGEKVPPDQLSFDFLMNKYLDLELTVNVKNWKSRPLSDRTKNLARFKSHYSLSLYDAQKQLLGKGRNGSTLRICYEYSKSFCLPNLVTVTGDEWMYHYRDLLNRQQMQALVVLNDWRKSVAQTSNKNVLLVATNRTLVSLAKALPCIESQFLEIFQNQKVPQSVKAFERELPILLPIFKKIRSSSM